MPRPRVPNSSIRQSGRSCLRCSATVSMLTLRGIRARASRMMPAEHSGGLLSVARIPWLPEQTTCVGGQDARQPVSCRPHVHPTDRGEPGRWCIARTDQEIALGGSCTARRSPYEGRWHPGRGEGSPRSGRSRDKAERNTDAGGRCSGARGLLVETVASWWRSVGRAGTVAWDGEGIRSEVRWA